MLGAIVDFLFPPHCPLCDAYVEQRGQWCPQCLAQVLRPREIKLSAPMQTVLHSAWALSVYRGGMKKLITSLKFNGRKDRLPYLNSFLQAAGKEPALQAFVTAHEQAIPVPLHVQKLKKRGFNQVELIFGPWLKSQGMEMQNVLRRDRASQPMYLLSPEERRANLADIFSLRAGADVRGKSILLLDDILTTGTTLYEAGKALKSAGARQIDAMVLATDH